MANFYIEKEYKIKFGFYLQAKNYEKAVKEAQFKCADLSLNVHKKMHEIRGLTKYESNNNGIFNIKEVW